MSREFQILACVDADGVVRRKYIVTKIEEGGLSVDRAVDAWFTLEGDHWTREVTPEVIAYETRHEEWREVKLYDSKLSIVDGAIEQSPDFPTDTSYRDAWVLKKGAITHDMNKARALHRVNLRIAREPLMLALDVAQKRAMVAKDDATVKAIEVKLQALRDVTAHPSIDAAASIHELKAVWPEILGKPNGG